MDGRQRHRLALEIKLSAGTSHGFLRTLEDFPGHRGRAVTESEGCQCWARSTCGLGWLSPLPRGSGVAPPDEPCGARGCARRRRMHVKRQKETGNFSRRRTQKRGNKPPLDRESGPEPSDSRISGGRKESRDSRPWGAEMGFYWMPEAPESRLQLFPEENVDVAWAYFVFIVGILLLLDDFSPVPLSYGTIKLTLADCEQPYSSTLE
ncbi:uncharacterized protein B0T15DRAFT_187139 [Chaetomium strumarium]|uniref:Uncharacterized protein n=1 Tax=Chaetomium strumarium TaxID=1170767 RepID=A0AAJ0GRY0_9PEZI|nr:hypothetical protein B0T15DRAFT_187139 [Chaetomium strumarium]